MGLFIVGCIGSVFGGIIGAATWWAQAYLGKRPSFAIRLLVNSMALGLCFGLFMMRRNAEFLEPTALTGGLKILAFAIPMGAFTALFMGRLHRPK